MSCRKYILNSRSSPTLLGEIIKVRPGFMRQTLHPEGWALYVERGRPTTATVVPAAESMREATSSYAGALQLSTLLRVGIPSLSLAAVWAQRQQRVEAERSHEPEPSGSHQILEPEHLSSLREALDVLVARQADGGAAITVTVHARAGVLFGSVRDSMIAEAVAVKLNELGAEGEQTPDTHFLSGMLHVVGWRILGSGASSNTEPGGGQGIKTTGTYRVSVGAAGCLGTWNVIVSIASQRHV